MRGKASERAKGSTTENRTLRRLPNAAYRPREQPNNFNRDLAEALVQIAREWVKVDRALLETMGKITAKVPIPPKGMTDKNKKAIRQFDDAAVVERLLELPDRLWREVKRDANPSFRMLARAQAAIAIRTLTYNQGNPMDDGTIYGAVRRQTHKALGVAVSLHRFRKAALSFWSVEDPASIRAGKDLLGHRSFGTTEKFYITAQSRTAGRVLTAAWNQHLSS